MDMFTLVAIFYFVPTLIALFRSHPNGWPILVINFFLGWTLIGWVVALAMAVSNLKGTNREHFHE